MPNFKCLFTFSSATFDLAEIKRLDLGPTAQISDVYKWLLIAKSNHSVWQLDFKSMLKEGSVERREFEEGSLQFGESKAELSLLGAKLVFERRNELGAELESTISQFLTEHHEGNEKYSFRPLKPSDVKYFKTWLLDEEAIRFSATTFHRMQNQAQVESWLFSALQDSKTIQFGLIDPITNELIGYTGIARINEVDRNGEFFIFIGNKSYWGKGIASHVTKRMVDIGFEKFPFHRIFLTASSKNEGALRAYVKAGFILEGRERDAFYRNSEYSDKVIMGILRSEYRKV